MTIISRETIQQHGEPEQTRVTIECDGVYCRERVTTLDRDDAGDYIIGTWSTLDAAEGTPAQGSYWFHTWSCLVGWMQVWTR